MFVYFYPRFEVTSRSHPLACWVSAMLSCFAGGVLVAPLCGEPIMAAFADGVKVLIASLLWFLIYYKQLTPPQDSIVLALVLGVAFLAMPLNVWHAR